MRIDEVTSAQSADCAGCIFFAKDTRRFLLAQRSDLVNHSGTWSTWGGAIDPGESPAAATAREAREEAGISISTGQLLPLLVFYNKENNSKYYNYLAIVEEEFSPNLNWENRDADWFEFGKWPSPLHFGVSAVLADSASLSTIKSLVF